MGSTCPLLEGVHLKTPMFTGMKRAQVDKWTLFYLLLKKRRY